MKKKIVISIVVILILVVGGGFFLWQDQKDVRELNKGLPEGVRVVKSLIGKEYRVVNKIDGYEIKVPGEWEGLAKIEYEEDIEKNSKGFSLEGPKGELIAVGYYQLPQLEVSLDSWVQNWQEQFKTTEWTIEKEEINHWSVIKAKESKHLAGLTFVFFKKDLRIYSISAMPIDEKFISEIILNGKW